MLHDLYQFADRLIGLQQNIESLTLLQVGVRAALTYLFGYGLLRIGEHRFVGKNTAFDVVLGFIFGATLSRAINGSAPFVDTILAGTVLLGLHWIVTQIAFRYDGFDAWLNGDAVPLVENGEVLHDNMRKSQVGKRVLLENLRLQGGCDDVSRVERACYERNGAISVIQKNGHADRRAPADAGTPRVIEIEVKEGVQTVRVELD